jgi:hypothetical protein
MDQQSIDYFRDRERVERAAAKAAATEAARRAHLELAKGYAALSASAAADRPDGPALPST